MRICTFKKALFVLCLLAVLGIMSGCGRSSHMQESVPPATGGVPGDKAAIVFYRPHGDATQAPIAEYVDGDVNYVAIVSAKTKFLHLTTPGKHVYVVGGESSHLLEANLEGGKIYYVKVVAKMGMWKGRFGFSATTPADMEKVEVEDVREALGVVRKSFVREKRNLSWCKWYENGPSAETWFQANKDSMLAKYAAALADFNKEDEEDRAIVRPEYGFDAFVE